MGDNVPLSNQDPTILYDRFHGVGRENAGTISSSSHTARNARVSIIWEKAERVLRAEHAYK